MNILIDGYNMIKQALKKTTISERQREQVLTFLERYAQRKHHTIHIIFDGGPYERPTKEQGGSLTVVYSGRRQSADDVIKTYIEEKLLPGMLVVTTDRVLNAFASRHSVKSIDSHDFYALITEKPSLLPGLKKVPGKAQKFDQSAQSSELDKLMEEGSAFIMHKDEHEGDEYTEADKAKKRSKHEKELERLIKKL